MIYVGLKCSASLSWFLSAHEIHRPKIHSPCCQQGPTAPSWLLPSKRPSRFLTRLLSEVSFLLSLLAHQLGRGRGNVQQAAVSLVLPAGPATGLTLSPCILARLLPRFALPAPSTLFSQRRHTLLASQGPYFGCPFHQKHPLNQVFFHFSAHTHLTYRELRASNMQFLDPASTYGTTDGNWSDRSICTDVILVFSATFANSVGKHTFPKVLNKLT